VICPDRKTTLTYGESRIPLPHLQCEIGCNKRTICLIYELMPCIYQNVVDWVNDGVNSKSVRGLEAVDHEGRCASDILWNRPGIGSCGDGPCENTVIGGERCPIGLAMGVCATSDPKV
jgi:hypothetical protein